MSNSTIQDEKIQFAISDTSKRLIIVAQSDKGLCAVLLGSDPHELKRHLQERFPKAILVKGDAKVEKVLANVVKLMENPSLQINAPLDERGTPFQLLVWKTLREIPCGSTASYMEIAKKIKLPRAARAVAGACAANPLALITPCHRVIRTDGALSGYRWGVNIKRNLLALEKK